MDIYEDDYGFREYYGITPSTEEENQYKLNHTNFILDICFDEENKEYATSYDGFEKGMNELAIKLVDYAITRIDLILGTKCNKETQEYMYKTLNSEIVFICEHQDVLSIITYLYWLMDYDINSKHEKQDKILELNKKFDDITEKLKGMKEKQYNDNIHDSILNILENINKDKEFKAIESLLGW